jgi:hypothetical protein
MRLFRHKKTGRVYEWLMDATLEDSNEPAVVYRLFDPTLDHPSDTVWVRSKKEFHDGRFERLDPSAFAIWVKTAPEYQSPF